MIQGVLKCLRAIYSATCYFLVPARGTSTCHSLVPPRGSLHVALFHASTCHTGEDDMDADQDADRLARYMAISGGAPCHAGAGHAPSVLGCVLGAMPCHAP